MYKIVILSIVLLVGLFRWFTAYKQGTNDRYLLISLFVQMLAFDFGLPIFSYLSSLNYGDVEFDKLGAFGNSYRIDGYFLFAPLFALLGYGKLRRNAFALKENGWFFIVLAFCLISLLNPINPYNLAVFPFLFSFLQLVFVIKIIDSNFSRPDVLKGVYDGLLVISILQLLLAICFPVLGINAATTWFKGEKGLVSSQRREGYLSAVGIFGHPGPLALYCLISGIFFTSCLVKKYKTKLSLYFLLINLFIIILTFSRTTYITTIVVLSLLYVVSRYKGSIFSAKIIIKLVAFLVAALIVLYLSPLSDVFLKSDAESQIDNRLAHWYLGYEVWSNSPLIGVGINSHVYYMAHHLVINVDLPILWFLVTNPIHNIHMIVLAETGFLGLILWLWFFVSSINKYSRSVHTASLVNNIFNLTLVGSMVAFFVYGFFGYSPFYKALMTTVIFLCYFGGISANKSKL